MKQKISFLIFSIPLFVNEFNAPLGGADHMYETLPKMVLILHLDCVYWKGYIFQTFGQEKGEPIKTMQGGIVKMLISGRCTSACPRQVTEQEQHFLRDEYKLIIM